MPSSDVSELGAGLRNLSETYGMGLAESTIDACLQHFHILLKWNKVMNLVGDLTVESAIHRHYGESLFLACALNSNLRTVADYGSGAGFPGIGVGAVLPSTQVELLEIRQKRVAFLRESTRGMANVRVQGGPAKDYADHLDAVVARAIDIEEIVGFARHRSIPAWLLVGANDAAKWMTRLESEGRQATIIAIPWRPQAVILSVSSGTVETEPMETCFT